jgi:hypothetical protein
MSDFEQLLLDAYKGEVFGDAIFSEMAAHDDWRDHRDTLQTLANIEARTAAALRPLVAHEQAISAFAQLEIAGFHDVSSTVLTRYLETAP